jgi:hypothetical protein
MTGAPILRQHGRSTWGKPSPIVEAIAKREPFRSGALRAETLATVEGVSAEPWWFGGRLTTDLRTQLYNEAPTYVVLSYSTPIAWWSVEHGWTVPDERYSATTSRHQGFVQRAIALP